MSAENQKDFILRISDTTREQFETSTRNLRAREALYKHAVPAMYDKDTERIIAESQIIPFEHKMIESMRLTGDETIVDAGCGDGSLLMYLWQRYGHHGELLGIDKHGALYRDRWDEMGNNITPINFLRGDVENLNLIDSSRVDVVVSAFVLYHVDHPKKALQEFRRILKPNGMLAVATRSEANLSALWHLGHAVALKMSDSPKYRGISPPESFYPHFDTAAAKRMLPEAGFEIIKTDEQRTLNDADSSYHLELHHEDWDEFEEALLSLRDSFSPQPVFEEGAKEAEFEHDMRAAIHEVVKPFFHNEIDGKGSFRMSIDQSYFICRNTKTEDEDKGHENVKSLLL